MSSKTNRHSSSRSKTKPAKLRDSPVLKAESPATASTIMSKEEKEAKKAAERAAKKEEKAAKKAAERAAKKEKAPTSTPSPAAASADTPAPARRDKTSTRKPASEDMDVSTSKAAESAAPAAAAAAATPDAGATTMITGRKRPAADDESLRDSPAQKRTKPDRPAASSDDESSSAPAMKHLLKRRPHNQVDSALELSRIESLYETLQATSYGLIGKGGVCVEGFSDTVSSVTLETAKRTYEGFKLYLCEPWRASELPIVSAATKRFVNDLSPEILSQYSVGIERAYSSPNHLRGLSSSDPPVLGLYLRVFLLTTDSDTGLDGMVRAKRRLLLPSAPVHVRSQSGQSSSSAAAELKKERRASPSSSSASTGDSSEDSESDEIHYRTCPRSVNSLHCVIRLRLTFTV